MPQSTAQYAILKTTTDIKLQELTKNEQKLVKHYAQLQQTAQKPLAKRLQTLYDGIKDLQFVQTHVHSSMKDVEDAVAFAQFDKWSTDAVLKHHEATIQKEMAQRTSLWRHNTLFGALLMDCLKEQEQLMTMKKEEEEQDVEMDDAVKVDPSSDANPLDELTKEETQKRLESYFFQSSTKHQEKIHEFLENQVFVQPPECSNSAFDAIQETLSSVRSRIRSFGEEFLSTKVTSSELKAVILILEREKASFSPDVVQFLQETKANNTVLEELAHVLTIQLSNLREFQWPTDGVHVDIKRGINGRFRSYLQEDVLMLLLFQYIGLKWSILMRRELSKLLMALEEHGDGSMCSKSIQSLRQEMKQRMVLSALPTSLENEADDQNGGYDGDAQPSSPVTNKQDILRFVCAEALYHQAMIDSEEDNPKRSTVIVTTDLEFFGPSLPHEAVLAVLQFLQVPAHMLKIFRSYLQIPLCFPGANHPRLIQRGVPVSRKMSLFFAEIVLFAMDYYVKSTSQVFLFRQHDDICFYAHDETKALKAWDALQTFADHMGLKFNTEKSGSVRIQIENHDQIECGPAPLPQQSIKWGLLELRSDATVGIRHDSVSAFAEEMKLQLIKAQSVVTWVNVYNKYMYFLLRNFGSISPVFGHRHLDDILEELERIHQLVLPSTNGDAVECLRQKIRADASVPAAWVYWPLDLGGLGLFNPFLAVWSFKQQLVVHMGKFRSQAMTDQDTESRNPMWTKWNYETMPEPPADPTKYQQDNDLMPFVRTCQQVFKEFDAVVEQTQDGSLRNVLQHLGHRQAFALATSSKYSDDERKFGSVQVKIDRTFSLRTRQEFVDLLQFLPDDRLTKEYASLLQSIPETEAIPINVSSHQDQVDALLHHANVRGTYWQWVCHMYHHQILNEFGTLEFFSRELLPAQLIAEIKRLAVTF